MLKISLKKRTDNLKIIRNLGNLFKKGAIFSRNYDNSNNCFTCDYFTFGEYKNYNFWHKAYFNITTRKQERGKQPETMCKCIRFDLILDFFDESNDEILCEWFPTCALYRKRGK